MKITDTVEIDCPAKFSPLEQQFRELFSSGRSSGCGLSVWRDGEPLLAMHGGYSDPDDSIPWQADTLCCTFSACKPFLAVAILQLEQREQLDLDTPVAHYWPEFSQRGKASITARQLLEHSAGIPAFSEALPDNAAYDWKTMISAVERMKPIWPAGHTQGYHPFVFGWALGGLLEKISGLRPDQWIQQEICQALTLDFHIGMSAADQQRCAHLRNKAPRPAADASQPAPPKPTNPALSDAPSLNDLAFKNPLSIAGRANSRDWRGAVIPAGSGHGTALALSTFYASLLEGFQGPSPLNISQRRRIAEMNKPAQEDAIIGIPMAHHLGFHLGRRQDLLKFAPDANCFGHPGAGGSTGFADPQRRIAVGFCTRDLSGGMIGGGKIGKLVDTLYQLL